MKYKVTMICKEIWTAETEVEANGQEQAKDKAWAGFDVLRATNLEQENYTKVEVLKDES